MNIDWMMRSSERKNLASRSRLIQGASPDLSKNWKPMSLCNCAAEFIFLVVVSAVYIFIIIAIINHRVTLHNKHTRLRLFHKGCPQAPIPTVSLIALRMISTCVPVFIQNSENSPVHPVIRPHLTLTLDSLLLTRSRVPLAPLCNGEGDSHVI